MPKSPPVLSKPARKNRLFTPEEDAQIVAMRFRGMSWKAIGRALGRNAAYVESRAAVKGLKPA